MTWLFPTPPLPSPLYMPVLSWEHLEAVDRDATSFYELKMHGGYNIRRLLPDGARASDTSRGVGWIAS